MNAPQAAVTVRPAHLRDVPVIHALLKDHAARGNLLPRTRENLTRDIRDFLVAEADGTVLGTGALEIMGPDLGEIRSLVVDSAHQRGGVGLRLARALIEQARAVGLTRVMALTYVPPFFERLGFHAVGVETLPEKVWQACVKCYKFNRCDEIAMMLALGA